MTRPNTPKTLALLVAALTLLTVLTVPRAAHAHHVVSESGIAFVEPMSVAEVELRAASFDFGRYFRGDYQILTAALEWAATDRFSATARVPVAYIQYDDGRQVIGLSDVELSAKFSLYESDHGGLLVSAGAGTALPTGVEEDGLGAGHVEFSPFVAVSTQPADWLVFYALGAGRFSVFDGDDAADDEEMVDPTTGEQLGPHGSVLSPHSPQEAFTRLGGALVWGPAYASVGVDHVFVLDGAMDDTTVLRNELGWARAGEYRLAAGVDLPVAGADRYGWQGRVSVAWMF
ncbi:hypothetical protein FIV42_20725 [Persicimonas caeni]|uniref:Uncharacterized protein n=1 Tax=Persicimonas caeni TaxID=2292766 RepID=A0A4Y6PXW0_PERCE|nr:hypothetical protein [Persicimonas caeni]QDG53080.1 hypothetical protein FIV42_20725 [Persicimonas caeni]QED34302.1 hypothetical protein FRD00_20720 [Persicimonas caeni]